MTETLAHLSNNAMYSATIVYALAMSGAHRRVGDGQQTVAEVAGRDRASTGGRAADLDQLDQSTRGPLVSEAADRLDQRGATGSSESTRRRRRGPARTATTVERSDRYGRIGLSLTVLGLLLQAVGVVARGIAAERVPWGSMYEFAITGSLAVARRLRRCSSAGTTSAGSGCSSPASSSSCSGIAVIVLYRPVGAAGAGSALVLAVIHVSSAAIAGGAFTVGALASVLYLLRNAARGQGRGQSRAAAAVASSGGRPDAESIDRVAYRVHAFAFPLWTFAVLCGRDLGGVRLGPILGLGPQGGLGVHHLGRLRRLPARPRDGRLAGPRRGLRRAARLRDVPVQLRRHQPVRLRVLHSYSGM